MKRILICAAIPREFMYIEGILSSLNGKKGAAGGFFSVTTGSVEVVLFRTGIGIQRAESSIQSLLNGFTPQLMISLGFGGALDKGLAAGDLVWASRVLLLRGSTSVKGLPELSDISLPGSKKTADRLPYAKTFREGCIVTLEHFMTKSEIRKSLPEGILFPVCDMETFVLARAALQRHIPFFAARSISDTADQEIPHELLDITDASGKIAYRRLVMSLVHRPELVNDLVRLGLNSKKAARSLGDLIKSFLDTAFMHE